MAKIRASPLSSADTIGAKAWPRANLRVVAAGVGALLVDGAAAGAGIQIDAIVVGAPRQRKNGVFEIEVRHNPGFFQPFGNLLGRLAGFKFIHHSHPHQIGDTHFHRHGAAGAETAVAQAIAVFQPGFGAGQIGLMVNDDFFHANNSLR